MAYQATADALLAITAKLGQFRGESRFTTWAYKFVILDVSDKTGRLFWRRPDVPLDAEDWDRLPGRFGFEPAKQSEWRDLLTALRLFRSMPSGTPCPSPAGRRRADGGRETTVRSA